MCAWEHYSSEELGLIKEVPHPYFEILHLMKKQQLSVNESLPRDDRSATDATLAFT